MSHIHIVEPYHSTAMRKMAEPLLKMSGFESITSSETIDPQADLNYHIPWHSLTHDAPAGKHAMLYTHLNPPAKNELIRACLRADAIVAMSRTGRSELINLGIPAEKITVIYAGHTDYNPRCLRVGVLGYEQPNGRKRGHILLDLCWITDVSRFQFIITGGGWDDLVARMTSAGANVEYLPEIADENMQAIYNALDALLVTSYVEGGPLTVLEALSAGIQVIAPPVGYANDLIPGKYIYRTIEQLRQTLDDLAEPVRSRRELVEKFTWQAYADQHAELFGKILCQSMSTSIPSTI